MSMFINPSDVQILVLAQLAGMALRPDIAAYVPHKPAALDGEIKHLGELEHKQELAKRALVAATAELRNFATELRDKANRNIAAVLLAKGKYSPDLRAVGAVPLTGRRGSGSDTKTGPKPTSG